MNGEIKSRLLGTISCLLHRRDIPTFHMAHSQIFYWMNVRNDQCNVASVFLSVALCFGV